MINSADIQVGRVGSNMAQVCHTNALSSFWGFLLSHALAYGPICAFALILFVIFVRRRSESGLRAWLSAGFAELIKRQFLLGLLVLEAALMIVTFAPYQAFGIEAEKFAYATFALPCLAALVGGGGLIFDRRDRLDFNGWAYVLSALLLLAAFVRFIWDTPFFDAIVFLSIPTGMVTASIGLIVYRFRVRGNYSLSNFYVPLLLGCGVVIAIMGFLFYGIFFQECHLQAPG